MTLGEVIESVRRREHTLTLHNPPKETAEAVVDRLADRNVEVRVEESASGRPEGVAVLERDGVVVTTLEVSDLHQQLADAGGSPAQAGGSDGTVGVLQHLDGVTFTSYDRKQMLAATREIEDRAYRVGAGTIRAGFQTVARLGTEADTYASLAERGLQTIVYAVPDGSMVPALPGVTVQTPDAEEIADHWFVTFDGGAEHDQQSVLLAQERRAGFYGFWSYDPEVVRRVNRHLQQRYDRAATDA